MSETLDEKLEIAIRAANRYKIVAFLDLLAEHKKHPTFRTHGWVFDREIGFVCCGREFRTPITSLCESLPEARESFMHLYNRQMRNSEIKRQKAQRKAEKKAKALLFRFLTKEQKWSLRADRSFNVVGQDGLTYRIIHGEFGGSVIWQGKKRYCFHSKEVNLPHFDLMLAQKLYIETRTTDFLTEAHVTDPDNPAPRVARVTDPASIPDEATADPGPFLRAAVEAA